MTWSRKFEDPIPLPDGRNLITLRDAANYIMGLSTEAFASPDWQVAVAALVRASESEPTTLARIAVMRALNSSSFNPPQRYQS